ncbi:MAG: Sjogren's syndrome/scleroderma autoantigen 1 family protein [Methanosarcinaceae archaeon]
MSSDNEQVRKISRLLELGGTMLAEHCNICSSPMFRYHGNVICPVCNTREEGKFTGIPATPSLASSSKTSPGPTPEQTQLATRPVSQITGAPKTFASGGTSSLEELLFKKITIIANSMQNETDTRRISEQLDIIERGLNVIEKLKNIT